MNIKKLKKSIQLFKEELGEALIPSAIWDKKDGLYIVSYNPNNEYIALFTRLTKNMNQDLKDIGFSAFGAYQLIV